nr:26S proteasome non-ATPase regulatory subunit 9 [Tanacetum cinerariifolium]
MDYTGGYGTVYKAWRKEYGITFAVKYRQFEVEDWSATSIDWEISDDDEENYERMTMQVPSGVTDCESKGEHDGKISDMIVDTSLASPEAPNMIVSIKSIAEIGKSSNDFASCFSHINVFAYDMSRDYVSGMDVDVNVSRPFVMAQAAYDGLQLEDQIVKIRDVEYGDNLLPKLAYEAQKNQGHPVLMLVMKQRTSINLAVKPKTWRHRGLLGSHQLVESLHKQVKVIVALHEIESYITIIVTKGLAQLGLSDAMGFESISLAQSRLVITLLT